MCDTVLSQVSDLLLSSDLLLDAYRSGVFPMTDADGVTRWYTADPRGVLPLDAFHCPKSLGQIVRQRKFDVRINHDFEAVVRACKSVYRPDAQGEWIGEDIVRAYTQLHRNGHAHCVAAYQNQQLVGGLYGVSIGGAFFGESMFFITPNASKVCLVHLVQRLRARGYALLDTQMVTHHMKQFGCTHIPGSAYMQQLEHALTLDCTFV
jgi:leucyl/phenylalanyl-tRNA---protein transferase